MISRLALVGAGLALAAASQGHAQAIRLRYTPAVGQVTRYRTVSQLWQAGDTTATAMTSTVYSTRTVTGMDGENYVVKTVFDSTITSGAPSGRPGAGGDMMRGMALTQHLDARGHVLSTEMTPPPGLPPIVANMMQKNMGSNNNRSATVMPEGAISPGYTWTDSMTIQAGRGRAAPVTFIVTYKFDRVERRGGARIAIVTMNGSQQGGSTGTMSGEYAFDVDGGRVAHLVTNVAVQAADGGAPMRMRSTMETLP